MPYGNHSVGNRKASRQQKLQMIKPSHTIKAQKLAALAYEEIDFIVQAARWLTLCEHHWYDGNTSANKIYRVPTSPISCLSKAGKDI